MWWRAAVVSPMVIKSVRPNVGSHHDRARVSYEHKLLHQIIAQGGQHVLQPVALLTEQAALGPHVGMVSHDIGGISLRAHGRNALSFAEILHVAEHVAMALESVHLEAQSPDVFLCGLFDTDPTGMLHQLHQQVADMKNPPTTMRQLVNALATIVPEFAAVVGEC